jgi:hypothetical protein
MIGRDAGNQLYRKEQERQSSNRSNQTLEQKASEAKRVADRRSNQTAEQKSEEHKSNREQHKSAYDRKTDEEKSAVRLFPFLFVYSSFIHFPNNMWHVVEQRNQKNRERKKQESRQLMRPDDPICTSCRKRVSEVIAPTPAARQHFTNYRDADDATELGRKLKIDLNEARTYGLAIDDAIGPNARSYVLCYLLIDRSLLHVWLK